MHFCFKILAKNRDAVIILNMIAVEDFISDAGKSLKLTNPGMTKSHAKHYSTISMDTQSLLSIFYKCTGQGYENLD